MGGAMLISARTPQRTCVCPMQGAVGSPYLSVQGAHGGPVSVSAGFHGRPQVATPYLLLWPLRCGPLRSFEEADLVLMPVPFPVLPVCPCEPASALLALLS